MTDNKLSGVLRPHISLDVKNVPASIAFYQALFGMEPKKVKHDYAKFELQNPPLNFSMNQKTTEIKEHGALNHLGFEVASNADVLSAKERLESSGLVSFDEMNVTCCYAVQDKIWVHDPDGNAWEIFVVTEANTESRNGRASGASEEACCVQSNLGIDAQSCLSVVENHACC